MRGLVDGLDTNRTLQYLGLSKNKMSSVGCFLDKIGRMSFPASDVDAH